MLVDIDQWSPYDIAVFMEKLDGGTVPLRLQKGVYQMAGFGLDNWLVGQIKETYPDFGANDDAFSCYGVADSPGQILVAGGRLLLAEDRKFVIGVTYISADEQPESGGWRWHKWGPYIGTGVPTTEYIHDEQYLRQVYVYHVYEVK